MLLKHKPTNNPFIVAKYLRNWFATHQATAENVCPSSATVVNKPEGWDDALPFEAIPGPKGLPVIGNVWRFLPVIGPYYKIDFMDIAKTYVSTIFFLTLISRIHIAGSMRNMEKSQF